jgi:hypothetical protein
MRARGLKKITEQTLNNLAYRDAGPPYRLIAHRRVYERGEVLDWLMSCGKRTGSRKRKAVKS